MALKDGFKRRRKDGRWIVGLLFLLLTILTVAFYQLQRDPSIAKPITTDQVTLFTLRNINLVLIVAVLFVLLRNVFKLAVERRSRILGSKFKTKLLATYVGLSLIPVLVLFAYANELIQGSIDRWVDSPLATVLDDTEIVVDEIYQQLQTQTSTAADRAHAEIASLDLRDTRSRPELSQRLQMLLNELDLGYLAVYDGTEFIHGVVDPRLGLSDLPEPRREFLQQAASQGRASGQQIVDTGAGLLAVGFAGPTRGLTDGSDVPEGSEDLSQPVADESTGSAEPAESAQPVATAVVAAGIVMPADLSGAYTRLSRNQLEQKRLELVRDKLKTIQFLVFLMVTLMILLASSWIGLLLARRITGPIQAFAEGTRRVSEGDLDHRIEVDTDDELGVLVNSFNRMTEELQRNRQVIDQNHRELVETNGRLAEERALVAAVNENVAAGILSVDRNGTVLTCNEAALEMLGQQRAEVVGNPLAEAWRDPERQKLARLLADDSESAVRRPADHDLHLLLDGRWKSFEAKVTPLRSMDGELRGRVLVLEDLTELIQAQQLAAWNVAARRIAHEIKNPLTPIKLAAERLVARFQRGDDDFETTLEDGVEIIVREVGSMQGMVDEFSRFARMPQPQPQPVDLATLVDETLDLYRDLKPGVEVAGNLAAALPSALLDREQMRSVLINLLDNAVEATTAPGSVTVSAQAANGHVEIEVADTGSGVSPSDKEKLFMPYFSTKGRGTGLGLAIVHRIVSEHRGTIRVEDNRPRGTVFRLNLPIR